MFNKKNKDQVGVLKCTNLSKRGQVGETVTWIVATIIIVVILTATIFLSSANSAKFKKIQEPYFQTADVLASKSMFSYALTENGGKTVHSQIKEGGFNEFNGNLAVKIFNGMYEDDYLNNPNNIWLGIVENTRENCNLGKQFCILESKENNFFGTREGAGGGGIGTSISYHVVPHTPEKIFLDENKYLELVLIGK